MVRFRAGLGLGLGLTVDTQIGTIMTINEDTSPNLIGRQVDKSTGRQVDRSTSRQFSFCSLGSISHHALSPCSSSCTIPIYPFIYFGNIDLSTCRIVDLST